MEEETKYALHEQRVVDEASELAVKVRALGAFILDNPIYLTLTEEDQELLNNQLRFMESYLETLEKRIKRF